MSLTLITISSNSPQQDSILKISLSYEAMHVKLLSIHLTGALLQGETSIQFFASIPIPLRINETLHGSDNIEFFLNENLVPSYYSNNFEIIYNTNVTIIDSENKKLIIKKCFVVQNKFHGKYFDFKCMEICEQNMCRVKDSCTPKEYYDKVCDVTRGDAFKALTTEERFIRLNTWVGSTDLLSTYSRVRYKGCLESYITSNVGRISPRQRRFTAMLDNDTFAEIYIDDICLNDQVNFIKIKYLISKKKTQIIIKMIEREISRNIEYEKVVLNEEHISEFCSEKIYEIYIPEKYYTLDCWIFTCKFIITLVMDSCVMDVPISIAQNLNT